MLGISDTWPHQSERCVAGVECPRTTLPGCCRAVEGAGGPAVVLCSANSWLLSNEVEREETQPEGTAHPLSFTAVGSLWGSSSAQHQNAEWTVSSRGKTHPANTGSSHLQGEGRRNPRAYAGSDQSELAWLLPTNPLSCTPLLTPEKQDFPLCASASHKNASLVIKGHLASETLGF